MKARKWAIAAVTIGILTIAASRGDGQEPKNSGKQVESSFVTTVGTHDLCGGKVSVRVYEEDGKLNYRVTRNWSDREEGPTRTHTSGPVSPAIDKDAD
jgi:hypothetical protein